MSIHQQNVAAMQWLALQAIIQSKVGHTGMALSAAPITYSLYTQFINIAKDEPKWFNRDRFVLSAGHGSMALYSLLFFANLLTLDDIKAHKKAFGKTPGHTEWEKDNFIDASTGPLGQGLAMAVGMAFNEKYLANYFDQLPGLIDHYTYVVCGDGDLQEGVGYEAMNIAAILKLNKLIVLHDSNKVQLDTWVKDVSVENLEQRIKSCGWKYLKTNNDPQNIIAAIEQAHSHDQPTFIEVDTIIGQGTTKENTPDSHSFSPNENDLKHFNQINQTNFQGWQFNESIYAYFHKQICERGNHKYQKWLKLKQEYAQNQKEQYLLFEKFIDPENNLFSNLFDPEKISQKNVATRNYFGHFVQQFAQMQNNAIALSPDIIKSTQGFITKTLINHDIKARTLEIGIREFAGACLMNGMLLHTGTKPFISTFLVFSDYMKPAIRLGALMQLPARYIFTHDTYQVGGDGPTHQPYDQLPMLRAIENVSVWRPCDEQEVSFAFNKAFNNLTTTEIIILTRQPLLSTGLTNVCACQYGGYSLTNLTKADLTIATCGSEIQLAFEIAKKLKNNKNWDVEIISVPNLQLLLKQPKKYLQELFNKAEQLFTLEPSSDSMWYQLSYYAKNHFHFAATTFGLSMDGEEIYQLRGFASDQLIAFIEKQLK